MNTKNTIYRRVPALCALAVFTLLPLRLTAQAEEKELSAEEAARELANPNTPLASLTLKSQWRTWDGTLWGADGRDSGLFLFQSVLPFPVSKTDTIFFRPAFTYLVDQPIVNFLPPTVPFAPPRPQVGSKSGFGDMVLEMAYGRTTESGLLAAVGLVSSLPTGDSGLSNRTFTLGPEVFVGLFKKWGVIGAFPNHQWDVSGRNDISVTSIQPIAVFLPGGGWSVGTAGTMTYDWNARQWTIPVQLQVSKTVKIGKVPWKFAVEANYYVERPDALGAEWMVGLNITPVVPNIFANLFGGKKTATMEHSGK